MNQDALVYELKKKLAEINVIAFKLGANMDHIECYRCHEKGHYANCCTFRPDECFNCHEKGHYAANCPNKETTENNIDNQQGYGNNQEYGDQVYGLNNQEYGTDSMNNFNNDQMYGGNNNQPVNNFNNDQMYGGNNNQLMNNVNNDQPRKNEKKRKRVKNSE
ncbi:hypothetical protein ACF0H5_018163 [Mactra antiquata]